MTHRGSPEQLAHHFLCQLCPAVPLAGPGFCRATTPVPLAHLSLSSLADERDRVQKKTFTKWVNKHLIKVWALPVQQAPLPQQSPASGDPQPQPHVLVWLRT